MSDRAKFVILLVVLFFSQLAYADCPIRTQGITFEDASFYSLGEDLYLFTGLNIFRYDSKSGQWDFVDHMPDPYFQQEYHSKFSFRRVWPGGYKTEFATSSVNGTYYVLPNKMEYIYSGGNQSTWTQWANPGMQSLKYRGTYNGGKFEIDMQSTRCPKVEFTTCNNTEFLAKKEREGYGCNIPYMFWILGACGCNAWVAWESSSYGPTVLGLIQGSNKLKSFLPSMTGLKGAFHKLICTHDDEKPFFLTGVVGDEGPSSPEGSGIVTYNSNKDSWKVVYSTTNGLVDNHVVDVFETDKEFWFATMLAIQRLDKRTGQWRYFAISSGVITAQTDVLSGDAYPGHGWELTNLAPGTKVTLRGTLDRFRYKVAGSQEYTTPGHFIVLDNPQYGWIDRIKVQELWEGNKFYAKNKLVLSQDVWPQKDVTGTRGVCGGIYSTFYFQPSWPPSTKDGWLKVETNEGLIPYTTVIPSLVEVSKGDKIFNKNW